MKKRNHILIGIALALAMLFSIMAMGNVQAVDFGAVYSGEDKAFHDVKIAYTCSQYTTRLCANKQDGRWCRHFRH